MVKSTILIERDTREKLKQLGTKGQTYDDLINVLIYGKVKPLESQAILDSMVG